MRTTVTPQAAGSDGMLAVGRAADKRTIAAQLGLFLLAVAMLVPAVSPTDAMTGGGGVKLLFVARVAVLVALAHGLLRHRALGWRDVGLKRPDWRRLLVAVPTGGVMVVGINWLAHAAIVKLQLQPPDYAMFAPIRGNLGEYLFWLLPVTIGTAAFGEELIFRGFITDALRRLLGGSGAPALGIALALQAALFGGLHVYQGIGGMIAAGATGLALGLTWLIAGRNLWAGIVLHALLDGAAMTAIYLGAVTV